MFQITAIGSCRIATPLRLAREAYGFEINSDRMPGFCHSSAEAVQMVRHLKGDFEIEQALEPLVSRRGHLQTPEARNHSPSDLYIVELSSAKMLSIGSTYIQINYLYREFSDFFADPARASAFWNAGRSQQQDAIDNFLAGSWNRDQTQKDQCGILRLIRRRDTSEEDLRRDVRLLLHELPEVLFVTHVDALTAAGKPIPSRSNFIRMVERVVTSEGGCCYNPTAAMNRMGQEFAIEDYSDSLAHFTEDFAKLIFREWFDLKIADVMDAVAISGGPACLRRVLKPHVAARLAHGDAAAMLARLERLGVALPPSQPLSMLLADTYGALNRPDSAASALASAARITRSAIPAIERRRRAERELETGDYAAAAQSYAAILAENTAIGSKELMKIADTLKHHGQFPAAVDFYGLALNRNKDLPRACEEIFNIVTDHKPDLLHRLDARQMSRFKALLPPSKQLGLALATGQQADAEAVFNGFAAYSAAEVTELAKIATEHGATRRAADFVGAWRRNQGGARINDAALRAVIDGWLQGPDREDDLAAEIERVTITLAADPLHQEARIRLRSVRRRLLENIREAYRLADLAALDALKPVVDLLDEPISELSHFRLRLLFNAGNHAAALAETQKVIATDPENPIIWAMQMRSALELGDLLCVERAATKVIEYSDEDTQKLANEARSRLARNPALCWRAARDEADDIRAFQLLAVAARDPALTAAAKTRQRRIEARMTAELRASEGNYGEAYTARAAELLTVLPENERVLLACARALSRKRSHASALPIWRKLVQVRPGVETYQFQLDRCQNRAAASAKLDDLTEPSDTRA